MRRCSVVVLGPCLLLVLALTGCRDADRIIPSPAGPATIGASQDDAPWSASAPELPWPPSFAAHPWLTDLSTWYSTLDHRTERAQRRLQGAFGIGNGRVFGLIGLGDPLNTLCNHTGPSYQASENFFGDMSIRLLDSSGPIPAGREWVYRTRGTAIVGSLLEHTGELRLYTVDFVPPGEDFLVRTLVVHNAGTSTRSSLRLRIATVYDGQEAFEVVDGMATQHRSPRSSWLTSISTPGSAPGTFEEEALVLELGSIEPGGERVNTIAVLYTGERDLARAQALRSRLQEQGFDALLTGTRSWWNATLNAGATLQTPRARATDLAEGMLVTLVTQTDPTGAVSPMSRYSKVWLRDTYGPLRLYTRLGRPAEARAMLEYLYRMAIRSREIRNSYVLGEDVSTIADPADPETFWSDVTLMPGRNPVEAPSYLILEYGRLFAFTGDLALIAARYHYLRAALTLQEISPEGLMKFSGDETFRYTLMLAMGAVQDPTGIAWSANSSMAYLAALAVMTRFATLLGHTEDAATFQAELDHRAAQTDALYWRDVSSTEGYFGPAITFRTQALVEKPFEDVSTKPIFFDSLDPDSARARSSVTGIVNHLMREDGTLLTPDGLGGREVPGYTGMVPGLFLYNLARTDHPAAELAFDALERTASPSGNWDEDHWKDHTACSVQHAPSGRNGAEVAARYRPWEGSENIEALWVYLVGLDVDPLEGSIRLRPHLPEGWEEVTATGLPTGSFAADLPERFDVAVRREASAWVATLTSRSSRSHGVELRFVESNAQWGVATVGGVVLPTSQSVTEVVFGDRSRITLSDLVLEAGGSLEVRASFSRP